MQHNLEEFNDYLKEYLGIKERIEEIKNKINKLLQDDKLNKTISFYNSLNDSDKKIFDYINCNTGYVRYKLNKIALEKLQESFEKLCNEFIESDAFPFSKDEFHFFVSKESYLVDAITDLDSSELSKEENIFLNDSISCVYNSLDYNPSDYSIDDIPLIKVLYLRNKSKYEKCDSYLDIDNSLLLEEILNDIELAKRIDGGAFTYDERRCSCLPGWKKSHLKTKLLTQQQRILNSDAKNKDLLLFSIDAAFYEIELLSGVRVNDIYDRLNNMEVKNEHQRRKVEREKDALINAYYNLTNQNFRKNSGYYIGNHYMFARYETADPEISRRMLKMMKR